MAVRSEPGVWHLRNLPNNDRTQASTLRREKTPRCARWPCPDAFWHDGAGPERLVLSLLLPNVYDRAHRGAITRSFPFPREYRRRGARSITQDLCAFGHHRRG